ncbi:MAG: hypothetical protein KAY32_09055 [Candidatus Eisenbacteria sp.]|nr:hypothetical protein [Candidatus Eisenbacteria bacterium]
MGHPKRLTGTGTGIGTSIVLAVCLLGIVLCAAPAAAQTQAQRQIEVELRRSDTLIERARDEVAGVRNAFAHDRLRRAQQLQRDAWREFTPGDSQGLRRAYELTKGARGFALKAIEAAAIEKRARESVRAMIERARDRAAEVAPLVKASQAALAEKLFEQGLEQLRRARRAFQRSDPQAARLATLARNLIERAARAASGEGTDGAALEAALERTAALINEVRARLLEEGSPREAAAMLQEAARLLEQARAAVRDGHPLHAFRLGMAAREKALEVLTRLRHLPAAEELRATLQGLEALYDDLAPRVAASGNRKAESLFKQGREMLTEVRRELRAKRVRKALAALVAAETLLREASEALGER